MKKKPIFIIKVLLILVFLYGAIFMVFTQSSVCGDVNNDGSADIVDALLIAQFYVGFQPVDFMETSADVDANGAIDIVDALLIAQFYVGILDNLSCTDPAGEDDKRININFNRDWLFSDTDISNGQSPSLNESTFQNDICLPHANKIIRHRYDSDAKFRFISWYRKHFNPPASYSGKRFLIEFQGVATAAAVYVNGQLLGEHKGAYTGFTYDMTGQVRVGEDNVIAVRVDSTRRTDIPPEGSTVDYMLFGGIIRDVILTLTDPLHVDRVFVSSSSVSANSAAVNAVTRIVNTHTTQKSCTIKTTIADADGS